MFSSWNRIGADEALSCVLGPAKESNYALESPKGVYSVGP